MIPCYVAIIFPAKWNKKGWVVEQCIENSRVIWAGCTWREEQFLSFFAMDTQSPGLSPLPGSHPGPAELSHGAGTQDSTEILWEMLMYPKVGEIKGFPVWNLS